MSTNLAAVLYLVAGVLFIQALRGLSSPDTSRRGNLLGMIGMTPSAGRWSSAALPSAAASAR
jgi:NAD(P) transhydrogenase subunit beta